MTIPKNVQDALVSFDEWLDFILAEYPSGSDNWQAIRAHLLSQDAEIDRLHTNENLSTLQHNKLLAKYELAESRLAAANAMLLRYCVQVGELTKELDPHDPIFFDIQQLGADYMKHHFQGTGDEA